ncbi:MAG: hypothetical protein KAV00_12840 [Phycisphaerae bacterium]|nr:hypothetical protein [Phycisphaerae bacterium]
MTGIIHDAGPLDCHGVLSQNGFGVLRKRYPGILATHRLNLRQSLRENQQSLPKPIPVIRWCGATTLKFRKCRAKTSMFHTRTTHLSLGNKHAEILSLSG